jgi:hypothetical protein
MIMGTAFRSTPKGSRAYFATFLLPLVAMAHGIWVRVRCSSKGTALRLAREDTYLQTAHEEVNH